MCVGGEGVCVRRGCVEEEGEYARGRCEGGERMCMRGECECVRGGYVGGEGVEKVVSAMSVWPLGGVMCV